MSDNIMSFNYLKQNLGITYTEYTKLLEEADMNDNDQKVKDGNIDKNVFEDLLKEHCETNNIDYSDIEAAYQDSFDAFASLDGDGESVSYADVVENSEEAAQIASQTATSSNNYANSDEYKNREVKRPVALQNGAATVASPVKVADLMGQDVESLRGERASISDQIAEQRTQMETAKAEKQQAVDTAQEKYQTALNQAEEVAKNDESEAAQNFVDLKGEKDAKLSEIDNQKTVISDLTSAVENQKVTLSAISSQLSVVKSEKPSESSFQSENEDGETVVDEVKYAQAIQEWENQVSALEEQEKQAQDQLSLYEQQLGEAENALNVLEQESEELDTKIADALVTLQESSEAYNRLSQQAQTALTELETARTQLSEVTAPFEANIAQLQLNLAEYDTAISEAENVLVTKEEGIERLGSFENTALSAETSAANDALLSSNSVTLDPEEEKEYLKEYIGGDFNFDEMQSEGSNCFSKVNEDGTKDHFRVVNDGGEIKIIHTNVPAQGNPSTEVYSVDPLKDENGEDRTYSKYATSKEGVFAPDQVEMLAKELQDTGKIPEDVDITALATSTLSSVIEKYGNGEEFVANFATDETIASAIKKQLEDLFSDPTRAMSWVDAHIETYAALTALMEMDDNPELEDDITETGVTSEVGQDYLAQITGLTESMNVDGVVLNQWQISTEYEAMVNEILRNEEIPADEALNLISQIYAQEVNGMKVGDLFTNYGSFFNSSYADLLTRTYNETNDIATVIEMNNNYREITGQTTEDFFFSPIGGDPDFETSPQNAVTDMIYSMYSNASQEEIRLLNAEFPDFATLFQERYSGKEETQELNTLFTKMISNSGFDYKSIYEDKTNSSGWEKAYGSPGESAFKKIMNNADEFENSDNFIAALLWASGGNPSNFTEYFRSLSTRKEEKYLPILLEKFGGTVETK